MDGYATFHYLIGQTHHRVPLLNGTSGFEPPAHIRLREAWEQKNASGLLAYARELGAKVLIVHDHALDPEQKRVLFEQIQQQNIPARQHFEHERGADLVFDLSRKR
jgi:hypothetical protein